MNPLLWWAAAGAAGWLGYEKLVKHEAHPIGTLPAKVRTKAIALIHTSTNPTQLQALGTALARNGDPAAAAAAHTKAAAIQQQQAPFAAAIQAITAPVVAAVSPPPASSAAASAPVPPVPAPVPAAVVAVTNAAVKATGQLPPTIRQGSAGPAVVQWQTIIGATPDGQFGPKTKALTVAYQRNNGLSADGVVGPQTWTVALGLGA